MRPRQACRRLHSRQGAPRQRGDRRALCDVICVELLTCIIDVYVLHVCIICIDAWKYYMCRCMDVCIICIDVICIELYVLLTCVCKSSERRALRHRLSSEVSRIRLRPLLESCSFGSFCASFKASGGASPCSLVAHPFKASGGVHPVSITRFPLRQFSPGAGLLRNLFFIGSG